MRRIVEELDAEYPCLAFLVVHRHGLVPVGGMAIHVRIEAPHRSEAIKMLELFMNRLKTEVPIWKSGSVPC
jgi:molybdopterin synthase catalytic subunit